MVFNRWPTEAWRYEYLDGGGPWFFRDGTPRDVDNLPSFDDMDELYGCDTIENLNKYMYFHNVDVTNMCLVHYINIEVLDYNPRNGHIVFRKER